MRSGLIAAKAGPSKTRVWTVAEANTGAGASLSARIDGLRLVQAFGAACTPVLLTPFPVNLGPIGAGGNANGLVTIDFTGCQVNARFTATISFSGAAAANGTRTLFNQFQ